MQITHEQARKLIQFSLDGVLQSAEKLTLSAHLQDCRDCRNYAQELKEIERIILPLMKKHWNARATPLSIPMLVQNKSSALDTRKLLAIRSAVIGLVVVALFFSAWQFVSSSPSSSSPIPLVVQLVPTPSVLTTQSTNAKNTAENCEAMAYSVQQNDTLASIANRFLVPEDEIVQLNHLKTHALSSGMELVIPVCNFTPTGTIHPATFTITHTPIIQLTTSTPVGKY